MVEEEEQVMILCSHESILVGVNDGLLTDLAYKIHGLISQELEILCFTFISLWSLEQTFCNLYQNYLEFTRL